MGRIPGPSLRGVPDEAGSFYSWPIGWRFLTLPLRSRMVEGYKFSKQLPSPAAYTVVQYALLRHAILRYALPQARAPEDRKLLTFATYKTLLPTIFYTCADLCSSSLWSAFAKWFAGTLPSLSFPSPVALCVTAPAYGLCALDR
jgi:hypothetical protein